MLLASTLPCPAIRDAMVRSLKMHWEEDPKAVGTVGATAEPRVVGRPEEIAAKRYIAMAHSNGWRQDAQGGRADQGQAGRR